MQSNTQGDGDGQYGKLKVHVAFHREEFGGVWYGMDTGRVWHGQREGGGEDVCGGMGRGCWGGGGHWSGVVCWLREREEEAIGLVGGRPNGHGRVGRGGGEIVLGFTSLPRHSIIQ